MDWNDGAGIALTINGNRYASLPDSEKANTGGHAAPTPCQYDWRDGCDKTATWRVGAVRRHLACIGKPSRCPRVMSDLLARKPVH